MNEIMKLWSGLGFYRRAENIYKTCAIINNKFNGKFPNKYEDILSLPGIGRTTASAIVTFSGYGKRSILDGNVKRFLSRLFGVPNNNYMLNSLWQISEDLLPAKRPSDFIQAYMDIGSLVCKKSNPLCDLCPVTSTCKSYPYESSGSNVMELPTKKNTSKRNIWALAILNQDGEFYLEKISYNNLWNGLYSAPIFHKRSDLFKWVNSFNLEKSLESKIWKFSHDLSHIKFTFNVMTCNIKSHKKVSLSDDNWYNLSNMDFGIPKYQDKIFNKYKN
jgi:A/G-specific adenine glycosylase